MKRKIPGWITMLGLLVMAVLVVALAPASSLSIDAECKPEGWSAQIQARVQGQRFWASQLGYLDSKIESIQGMPSQLRSAREAGEAIQRQVDAQAESLYGRDSSLRPSPEQAEAESLRRRADAVEQAGVERMVAERTEELLQPLTACRSIIVSRASSEGRTPRI